MSVAAVVRVYCDGERDTGRCWETTDGATGVSIRETLRELAAAGWTRRRGLRVAGEVSDLCPECSRRLARQDALARQIRQELRRRGEP